MLPIPVYEIYKMKQVDGMTEMVPTTAFSDKDDAIGFLRRVAPGTLSLYVLLDSTTQSWKIGPVAVAEHLVNKLQEQRSRPAPRPREEEIIA